MSDGLRHRFSVETNNLPNFNRGTVYDQRFRDYERLFDANNYESMSEIDLTRLNSEQHFGETNFPEYYPRNTTDTSFIEPSNSNFLPPNENTPLLEPTQPGPNSSGSSGGGRSSTSGTLSGIGNAINTALPVGMPKERSLGPPPDERPNWENLNEGQKRYAYEQYNLARVRRGLPIDHPIPS
ncbi:UNVERIFIED_CONTAM: hypothetical protein NCL1_39929 [Trichonephila clavipes]